MPTAPDYAFRLRASFWPFVIFVTLFIVYSLIDLFAVLQPDVSAADWVVFVAAFVVFVHGWVIWVLYVGDVLVGVVYTDDPSNNLTTLRKTNLIINVGLLYVLTLLQNTAIFAAVARLDRDAFIGIDTNAISNVARIGLSLFLAVETVAALGTGAIFANAASVGGFLPIGLNSLQSLMFVGLILSKVAAFVSSNQEERLLRNLIAEIRQQRAAGEQSESTANRESRLQAIKFE